MLDVRINGSRLQRLDGAGLTALVVARRVRRERGREPVVFQCHPRRCAAHTPFHRRAPLEDDHG